MAKGVFSASKTSPTTAENVAEQTATKLAITDQERWNTIAAEVFSQVDLPTLYG